MTTGQTIEAKIIVDAKQATAEVEKFSGKLSSVEEKAQASGFSLANMQEQAKGLQAKLGPAAAAISGIASALGNTNGEAGKALAAIGQVTAAFAAGGPFGAALAAGTFAVDALTQAWEKEIKAQDAAINAQYSQFDVVNKTTKELEKQAEALRMQLEPLSPSEIRSRAKAEIERLDAIERQNKWTAVFNKERKQEMDAQNTQLERQKELVFEIADAQARLLERGGSGGSGGSGGARRSAATTGPGFALRFFRAQQEEAAQRARAEQQANREAAQRDIDAASARAEAILNAQEEAEKAKTAIAKREAEERTKIAEAEHKAQVDNLTALATDAAKALGSFAGQLATGQEAALENLLSAAAVQAGGMITLEGGKVLAAGIGGALLGNPAAPGQIAGGLGLVAAGSAIQSGGPAAVQALLGAASGASPSSATSAARDRGASPRSSSNTGGGGPLVLNIAYGVAGPLPEDTAREVARAMRAGNRRRGAA